MKKKKKKKKEISLKTLESPDKKLRQNSNFGFQWYAEMTKRLNVVVSASAAGVI